MIKVFNYRPDKVHITRKIYPSGFDGIPVSVVSVDSIDVYPVIKDEFPTYISEDEVRTVTFDHRTVLSSDIKVENGAVELKAVSDREEPRLSLPYLINKVIIESKVFCILTLKHPVLRNRGINGIDYDEQVYLFDAEDAVIFGISKEEWQCQ